MVREGVQHILPLGLILGCEVPVFIRSTFNNSSKIFPKCLVNGIVCFQKGKLRKQGAIRDGCVGRIFFTCMGPLINVQDWLMWVCLAHRIETVFNEYRY